MFVTGVRNNMRKYGPIETEKFNSDSIGIATILSDLKERFNKIDTALKDIPLLTEGIKEFRTLEERIE